MNQARKKVLYLITKATWGGAQRYVYDLATNLPKDEFEPVVAFGLPAQAGEPGRLQKMLRERSIETHRINALGRDIALISDIGSFFGIIVCLWRVRPDVVHLNSSKAAALGALAARIMFVPKIIFTVHGWPFNEKRNELARVLIYIVSWFTAFLSNEIIVVSRSDETQGKRMRWVERKIHYIPIGMDGPKFLSREEAVASLSIPGAMPRIVTIAELTPNKGLRFGIEAISLLKAQGVDVHYTLIGDGEQRAELENIAKEFGVEGNVTFTGFIPDASKYLKAFDVFLLPSIKEGMPYVLLEASTAGLAIVTTTVVNPDIAETYQNVRIVPPADPEALAKALAEAVKTRPGVEPSPAQNDFPLSKMLEGTISLYR